MSRNVDRLHHHHDLTGKLLVDGLQNEHEHVGVVRVVLLAPLQIDEVLWLSPVDGCAERDNPSQERMVEGAESRMMCVLGSLSRGGAALGQRQWSDSLFLGPVSVAA